MPRKSNLICPNTNLPEWKQRVAEVGIDQTYREWIGIVDTSTIDSRVQQAKDNLRKILPQLEVEPLDKLANSDKSAVGAFLNNIAYIHSNAPTGTEYHEAFHNVFRAYLSDSQIDSYLDLGYKAMLAEAKQKGTTIRKLFQERQNQGYFQGQDIIEATDLFVEEYLADKFKEYMRTRETDGWLSNLFKALKRFINRIFWKRNDIESLFNHIAAGEFANRDNITNRFSQEDYTAEPVYSLLRRALRKDEDGNPYSLVFGVNQTSELIRDVAAYYFDYKNSKLARRDRWTDDQIIDMILDLKKNYYSRWADRSNLGKEEHDLYYLYSEQDSYTSQGQFVQGERSHLKGEVLKYLSNFKRLANRTEEDELDTEIDDEGTAQILNAEMVKQGGWGTLPEFVRQYIAQVSYDVGGEIGTRPELGEDGLITQVPVLSRKVVNPTKVYNGLLRALANNTSEETMLEALIEYADPVKYIDDKGRVVEEGNIDTKHFVNKFLEDTKIDTSNIRPGEDYLPVDNLEGVFKYQKVINAFNRWAKDTIHSQINVGTHKAINFSANRKGVDRLQFESWHQSFNDVDNSLYSSIANKLSKTANLLRAGSPFYITDEYSSRDTKLQQDIGQIKQTFLSIGINLHPKFIKYSLLLPRYLRLDKDNPQLGEDTMTAKEYNFIRSYNVSYENVIKPEDITVLTNILDKGRSPFESQEVDQMMFKKEGVLNTVDTAATGRILNLAKGNAKFDETVFESSYQAADGTTRYLHQDGTYHLKAIGKLNNLEFFDRFISTGIRDETVSVYDQDGIKINIDDVDSNFVTDNYLSKSSDFQAVAKAKAFTLSEIDGISQRKTTEIVDDLTGDVVGKEEESWDGVHFSDMSDREFMVTLLNLYAKSSQRIVTDEGKTVHLVPQLISIMETSKSADLVNLPVIQGLFMNGGASEKMLDIMADIVEKEAKRISKTYSEITDLSGNYLSAADIEQKLGYVIDEYHAYVDRTTKAYAAGPNSRGLFLSDKIAPFMTTNQVKEIEREMIETGEQWFDENREKVKDYLFEGFNALIQETYNNLINSEVIEVDEKYNIKNNFLAEEYFKGNESVGLTADPKKHPVDVLKGNLGQVIAQHWVNTASMSHLLHGDPALMFKNDGADFYKREKTNNAKIVSVKHNRTIPALGVTPFTHSNIVIMEEPNSSSKINGDGIDQADAQVWCSVQAIRNSLFGMGRLTQEIASLLDKMERGEKITPSDLFDVDGELIEQDRFINSFKFVFRDSKRTVKMSVVPLTKELTSINRGTSSNPIWTARPGREQLHNMREAMDSKGIDFLGPKSAFKTYRSNILQAKRDQNGRKIPEYDFTQARSQRYDNDYFGLQMENPSNKTKITTPTQLLHSIDNEQVDGQTAVLIGDSEPTTIGEIRKLYQKALSNKSKLLYDSARAEMYNIEDYQADVNELIQQGRIVPRLAEFQRKAVENLSSSGADLQLLEFFELDPETGQPKFNLNNDLVLEKYSQLYLAHFSKGVFSMKNPGHAVALFSGFNMGLMKQVVAIRDGNIVWRVVRSGSKEYANIVNKQGNQIKKPNWEKDVNNKTSYRDSSLVVGDYFIDKPSYNVPQYDESGRIIGYFSEAVMPYQTLEQSGISEDSDIPEEIAYLFGNRIPLQDKHSMISLKWVDTMPIQYGSTGVFPDEIVQLSGADFDIDKLFISRFDTYQEEGKWYRYGESTDQARIVKEYAEWNLHYNKSVQRRISELKKTSEQYQDVKNQLLAVKEKIRDLRESGKDNLQDEILKATKVISDEETGEEITVYQTDVSSTNESLDTSLTKMDSLLRTAMQSELDEIYTLKDSIIESMRNIESAFLKQALKDSNLPSEPQDITKEHLVGHANNQILKAMFAMLTNDGIREGIADQPATQDYLANQKDNPLMVRSDGTRVFDGGKKYPLDFFLSHIQAKKKNNIGKDNIGVDVSGNVQSTILQKGKVKLKKGFGFFLYDDINNVPLYFDDYGFTREYDFIAGSFTGERIMQIISTKISASTDEAKDANNARFNLGVEESKVLSALIPLGFPFDIAIMLVNQPIIRNMKSSYKKEGLVLEEETKYANEDKNFDQVITELRDRNNSDKELTLKDFKKKYRQMKHPFNPTNISKVLKGEINEKSVGEDATIYNIVQLGAADTYRKAMKLVEARQNIGNILKLNKGIDSFDTMRKAMVSAEKLGLFGSGVDPDIPFDVRYVLTGNPIYKETTTSDYVHSISGQYLKQIEDLVNLSKLNFLHTTSFMSKFRERLGAEFDVRPKVEKQLSKDLLSFMQLTAYKNIMGFVGLLNNTYSENLITGEDPTQPNIVDVFDQLRKLAPNNPLSKYIIKVKSMIGGKPYYTIETNSFTRLTDIQLGNLINGYYELLEDDRTKPYAEAILDYLLVKDAFQFKNKSISKIIPAERFSNLSFATDLIHKIFIAETKESLQAALDNDALYVENPETEELLWNDAFREAFKKANTVEAARDLVLQAFLGMSTNKLFNRFTDLMVRQPAYTNSVYFTNVNRSTAMSVVADGFAIKVQNEQNASDLTKAGFFSNDINGVYTVELPKYVRNKENVYVLVSYATKYGEIIESPEGIQSNFYQESDINGRILYTGIAAQYKRITNINTNPSWNQMGNIGKIETDQTQEFTQPQLENNQSVPMLEAPKEEIKETPPVVTKEPSIENFADMFNQADYDEDDNFDYELATKSDLFNINLNEDTTSRCK